MLRKIKAKYGRKIANFVYVHVASKLPTSYKAKTRIPQKLRAWCARFLLDRCGENVNIEKNVELSWVGIELGDNSGFGEGSVIGGYTVVGKML